MSVSIVYETHSLTEDNEAGVATGWLPGKLSKKGRRLASEMGERRGNDGLAAVFVSDLARAAETATIAFGQSGININYDPRLRECNYGDLNGKPIAQLNEARLRHLETPFPGGQSYRDVVNETADFLADISRQFSGKRICIIAHSANKWALDVLLLGQRLEDLVAAPFDWQAGWEYAVEWPQ